MISNNLIFNGSSLSWFICVPIKIHNSHELKLHTIMIIENWKYLGNSFDCSLPKTCRGRLLNITKPPTNEIHIEHPNQEEKENKCDTIPNFLYNTGFRFISRSSVIISPEYLIDKPIQTARVNPSALKRKICRLGRKKPPGNWICWSLLSAIFSKTSLLFHYLLIKILKVFFITNILFSDRVFFLLYNLITISIVS